MPITGAFILPHPPLIVPEVGNGEERKIQKTIESYNEAARRIAGLKPDTIVIVSPHSVMYADYFHISPGRSAKGDLSRFSANTLKISVDYDTEFVAGLEREAADSGIPAGTQGAKSASLDHATYIPLYFINKEYANYSILRVGVSGRSFEDHYNLGKCIARTTEKLKRNVVFIASADLSHKLTYDGPYSFALEGPQFDGQMTAAMANADFLRFLSFDPDFCDKAGECGLRPCIVMAGALDKKKVEPQLLSYEGPFGVGYGIASYRVAGDDSGRNFLEQFISAEQARLGLIKQNEDECVRLARFTIENYIKTGKRPPLPDWLTDEMKSERAGVFVSLKKHGALRGCIGTIGPVTKNIAEEISRNAVSAATEDPRFEAIDVSELSNIVYSVDILGKPEPIDSPSELDAERYGVIVTSGYKRGLLLPNLEGVDTVEQQIDIALQKAGISKREHYALERFEVVRHK